MSTQTNHYEFHKIPYFFQFEFMLSFLNVIDLLGILPFFVSLVLNQLSSQYSLEYIAKAAQIFRILRILRIFKLSRHITGLKGVALAEYDSEHGHADIRWTWLCTGERRA
jgi:hypothetical protein